MGLRQSKVIGTLPSAATPVTEVDWDAPHVIEDGLDFPAGASPPAPAAGNVRHYAAQRPGGAWPAMETPDGLEFDWTWNFMRDDVSFVQATYGTNTLFAMGAATTVISTITAKNYADTDAYTRSPGVEYLVGTAATSAIAALRFTVARFQVGGSAAGRGGFRAFMKGSTATGSNVASHRFFMGFWTATVPTDVNPSTLTNIFGIGYDSADTNLQFIHNDAAGACTKIDLGASFPKPTAARASLYTLELYSPPGTTQEVHYRVTNHYNGAVATGTVTTNLPSAATLLTPHLWASVGGTSSIVGINFNKIAVKSLGRV